MLKVKVTVHRTDGTSTVPKVIQTEDLSSWLDAMEAKVDARPDWAGFSASILARIGEPVRAGGIPGDGWGDPARGAGVPD